MSNDTLKNRVRISSTLKPETNQMLKQYSKETQIPVTKIIESAVIEYINKKRGS